MSFADIVIPCCLEKKCTRPLAMEKIEKIWRDLKVLALSPAISRPRKHFLIFSASGWPLAKARCPVACSLDGLLMPWPSDWPGITLVQIKMPSDVLISTHEESTELLLVACHFHQVFCYTWFKRVMQDMPPQADYSSSAQGGPFDHSASLVLSL
ncbi:uncharacterized protein [Struthio camelus]|uniref:uncharacterized protein n=1 Tax=Struthio camelus TaxID=8801 RepID=UPI003603C22E